MSFISELISQRFCIALYNNNFYQTLTDMKTHYLALAFTAPIASFQTFAATSDENHPAAPTEKPNVILIYADDLGYGDLECYGAKNVQTPHRCHT